MRNLLMATAALAALAAASSAFAAEPVALGADLQVNLNALQVAGTDLSKAYVGGPLNVSTEAVGNSLSVQNLSNDGAAALGAELQVNGVGAQIATTKISDVAAAGKGNITTETVGNALSVSADNGIGANLGVQLNGEAFQVARTDISDASFGSREDGRKALGVNTTAVGNDISVSGDTAAFNLAGQANVGLLQVASTDVNFVKAGATDISTDAIGNFSGVTASANNGVLGAGIGGQLNAVPVQIATADISHSLFTGGLSVNTIAAGNVANVTVGH